jgi:glycosyltransferase involved in cell wall biosynthesis
MTSNYTITFACYNQLDYTKKFIASLDRNEVDFSRIIAVDNGSTDGTREWLSQQGFGAVILNSRNLGCGAAWNQGALAIQSKWTVVMNNDVICAKGWLTNLIQTAEARELKIASPAMIEGDLNYDFNDFVLKAQAAMNGYVRLGMAHAVCMAIHEDVWDEIGYFMPVPKLLGYEDGIFFQRAMEQKMTMGITADSWLHHFGQTTQRALKLELKLQQKESLGNRKLMQMYMGQSWLRRKLDKQKHKRDAVNQRDHELAVYAVSVRGLVKLSAEHWEWE